MASKTSDRMLTYADYVRIPSDGRRHEIIDGVHYVNGQRHDLVAEESLVNPAPGTGHQNISGRLFYHLFRQIELAGCGYVFHAPCDVQLSEHRIIQPDIVIVLKDRLKIITPTRIEGTPDLVVEILSPSSKDNDCVTKRALYQEAGVSEYWIVDPERRTVEQLVRREGIFQPEPESDERRLTIVEGVTVRLAEIWSAV